MLQRLELSPVGIIEVGIEQDNIASLRIFRQVGFIEKGVDVDDLLNSL